MFAMVAACLAARQISYLVYHTAAELFSIIIAGTVFTIALRTRALVPNAFYGLVGIALGAVGAVDLVHTLAFKGMNLLPVAGANAATQLWIGGRYLLALSLFAALLVSGRRRFGFIVTALAYLAVIAALFASVFGGLFPDCYVEGSGLTAFKIASEYAVMGILLAALGMLWLHRAAFDRHDAAYMALGLACLILTEFLFTLYIGVYDLSNFTGHIFKLVGYYFLYKALVASSLTRPMRSLFREADQRIQELTTLNRRIAAMQEQLVHSEKMGFLGKLAARFAHELNTPLATVASNTRNTAQILDSIFPHLLDRIRNMDEAEYRWFRHLAEPAGGHAAGAVPLPLDAAPSHRERLRLVDALMELGVPADGDLADCIQELGIGFDSIRGQPGRFRSASARDDLRHARNLLWLRRNNSLSRLAVEKANRTLQTIRRYGAGSVAKGNSRFDLTLVAEAVLGLYQVEMRDAVRLVRDFEPVPEMEGAPDQLGLAIGNLVENSLQAMEYRGTLTIGLRPRGTGLVLAVSDDGPGIPAELQSQVFQPFFTTKAAGEGVGLGLDLCRQIVQEHGGSLEFDSRPGATEFRVWLPAARPGEVAS
jgi:signal transduction histidine kinase